MKLLLTIPLKQAKVKREAAANGQAGACRFRRAFWLYLAA